jgi:ABC-type Mn2+/Zn2+ transport system permease subunit
VINWIVDPFTSGFTQRAAITCVLIGILAPTVGTWIVLRRLAYLGDAMSHATIGGVAVAFAIGGSSAVIIGALGAGVLMATLLTLLSANRRLGQDAAIGVIESAMFAIGVIIISRVDTGTALSHFLFGQLLTVQWGDVWLNLTLTVVGLGVIALMFGDLRMSTFDPAHAAQVGVRVQVVHAVLLVLLAVTVVVSLRTVGTLMSVAMLVTPAAAARLLTRDVRSMTIVGASFGVAVALTGFVLSYHLDASPGAVIALVGAGMFAVVYVATLPRRMRHHARATA